MFIPCKLYDRKVKTDWKKSKSYQIRSRVYLGRVGLFSCVRTGTNTNTNMAEDYQKIRDDRARTDVYGRRIGRPSTCTNRMLYKPPPNFTIQQLRKYKKRKVMWK